MKLFQKIVTMAALLGGMTAGAQAQVLLGTFQSATDPTDYGWFDVTSGDSITNDANSSFVAAGVPGYADSLQITGSGGFGNPSQLELKLSTPQIEALLANSYITFTFAVPASSATGGYNQIYNLQFQFWQAGYNSGYGSTNLPWSNATAQGDTADNSGGQPNYYFPYSGNPAVVYQTVTVNYSSLLPAIQAGLNSGNYYLNIEFQGNTGGGAPLFQDFNDVVLSQGPYGSTPGAYTVDDFSTNGVNPDNQVGDDYYAAGAEPYDVPGNIATVWSEWFGNGGPGAGDFTVSFNPNVNVSGDTNSNGAMQLNFTWDAATDGDQQWLLWHGNANTYCPTVAGGSVGVGYPQYTNIECDVKFDPSSVTNANGDYGVLRMMARGVGDFGQPWISSSYTTITDTNWHHINAILSSSSSDAQNVGDIVIGEDVTSYVGNGGLTGNQILYIDNIRLTGPGGAVTLPPTVLNTPQQVSPGLRMFAGPTSTDDREVVYTEDQSQSWVDPGAHFPVSYTFSLLDLNPNIGQTMLEIMAGGSTTPTTYGEYADYSGPTTLWLTLAPGPTGSEVVANVAWKVNDPNANPTNTCLSFTNSTAIGTWQLVFTGDNAGHVVAPGSVVLGPTSFTISDPNVTTDFQDPGFVAIGNQPNSGAGQGTYEDFGFIGITNVVDGNEYENFTTESSDFVANFSPSGEFNNSMSVLPAAVLIQTTNDAWWLSWNSPALNMTLASITNLTQTNWINPGWYSGYNDTNAPRVMPLASPFYSDFWVLLPKDDLPTANGQQNTYTGINGQPGPASTPAAINSFFRLETNTVSP